MLYALVDGVQYETHRQARLMTDSTRYPLFTGTPDVALAHAGPWLVDLARPAPSFLEYLAALKQEIPSFTWLFAVQDLGGLAQLLQLHFTATGLPHSAAPLLGSARVSATVTGPLGVLRLTENASTFCASVLMD